MENYENEKKSAPKKIIKNVLLLKKEKKNFKMK